MEPEVVAIGSCTQDLYSVTDRFPQPNECVQGAKFLCDFGGKGANQGVMAARLGAKTAVVGKVGEDIFGTMMIEHLQGNCVNVDFLYRTSEASTATAFITINGQYQHTIVVVSAANMLLTPNEVRAAEAIIAKANVLVCSLGINPEAAFEALKIANAHHVTTVFNPAPQTPACLTNTEIYQYTDIICPNKQEAEYLAGFRLNTDQDIEKALQLFLDRGVGTAIITLGNRGCVFASQHSKETACWINIPEVESVDKVGASDAFAGALAFYTAKYEHLAMDERIRRSSQIALYSVQHSGTQSSYPKRDMLPVELFH